MLVLIVGYSVLFVFSLLASCVNQYFLVAIEVLYCFSFCLCISTLFYAIVHAFSSCLYWALIVLLPTSLFEFTTSDEGRFQLLIMVSKHLYLTENTVIFFI